MGVAATVYSGSLRDVIADPFAASLSLILAGIFVVGVLRKLNCMTVTDIIQNNYGKGAGIYASLWMIPVYIGWLGAQVLGLGTLLNLLTGIDLLTAGVLSFGDRNGFKRGVGAVDGNKQRIDGLCFVFSDRTLG